MIYVCLDWLKQIIKQVSSSKVVTQCGKRAETERDQVYLGVHLC